MQQIVQIALLVIALIVGAVILLSQTGQSPEDTEQTQKIASAVSPAEKMLEAIESQIADQEDVKDVRCWSSVNKIQTFLSGLPVELESNGRRVERYVGLIEDVWREAAENAKGNEIGSEALYNVFESRFPENVSMVDGKVKFDFGGQLASISILEEAVQDYSDTIESWRLLQSWALRKATQGGNEPVAAFSQDSLDQFRDFLVVFDIALLKSAKDVAMERKFASIDVKTMDLAFDRLLSVETSSELKDN